MSSKNITYGPSEQELIPAGVTQLFFPILWFIIHSITCYTDCHFSLNVFDKRLLVLLGQVLLFINIMYQPAQTPAAAAELSLNIRVSAGLFLPILWSHEMGEQLKGKQLPVASLCRAGHTHSHDPYRSRKARRVENGHAFPQHGPSERSGAPFAPRWPCSRLPLTQVCACNRWWLHVNPPLVPAAETCPNQLPTDFAGICSTAASVALPRAWYEEQDSSPRTAEPPARSTAGLGTCPSHPLRQQVLPALRLWEQCSGAQQRQEALFALLASS